MTTIAYSLYFAVLDVMTASLTVRTDARDKSEVNNCIACFRRFRAHTTSSSTPSA